MASTNNLPSLKIALVISELEVGGAEKNFTNLALGLARLGHQVKVFSLDPPPSQTEQQLFIRRLEEAKISVSFLTHNRSSILTATKSLRHELIDFHPQIVQAFLLRANLAAYIATKRLFPLVLGIRQADNRKPIRWLENYLIRRAKHTVYVSNQVAEAYAHTENTSVIANGVESQSLAELQHAKSHKNEFWLSQTRCDFSFSPENVPLKVHLFVGRLTAQKNILNLIKMVNQQIQDHPSEHFVILGRGPLEDEAKSLIANLPSAKQIHLVGWQPDSINWIKHSDTLLLASHWEGLPNVVLEAMSCGIPVLSFPSHGISDIFYPPSTDTTGKQDSEQQDRAFRLQVTAGKAESEFANAFSLLNRLENREFAGEWNRKWVENHFSIAAMTARYEQLFRQLATK